MLRFVLLIFFVSLNGIQGTPSEYVESGDELLAIDKTEVLNLVGSIQCTICEDVLQIVHAYLKDPVIQKFIINLLEKVCQHIPWFKTKCLDIVEEYAAVALNVIADYVSPSLCSLFHICEAGQVAVIKDNCRMCELGVGVIIDAIRDPESQERLKQLASDFCMEYNEDDKLCDSVAEEIVGIVLPLAEELHRSGFLRDACAKAGICSHQS